MLAFFDYKACGPLAKSQTYRVFILHRDNTRQSMTGQAEQRAGDRKGCLENEGIRESKESIIAGIQEINYGIQESRNPGIQESRNQGSKEARKQGSEDSRNQGSIHESRKQETRMQELMHQGIKESRGQGIKESTN